MKRGFALIGAAILLLLLIGCAHGEPTQPVHESTEQQPIDTPVTIEGLRWLSDQPSEQPDFPNRGVYIAYAVNNEKAGSIAGDTMQQIKGGKGTSAVRAIANYGYRFVAWSDGNTSATRRKDSTDQNTVITAIFDYDCSEIPCVLLTTKTGRDVTSKTAYTDGTLAIINADENEMETSVIDIRGRGNFTWTAHEKKSYKIKFPTKCAPLSIGEKNKTWVLMANVCDQTLLRNHVALKIVDEFDRIVYSPDSISVDVYLNGEYRGVYLLAEEITLSKAHVALDDSRVQTLTDTGYLLELSAYATDVAFTLADRKYEIKSDLSSNAEVAEKQKGYIADYVTQAYRALSSGDRAAAEQYIDIGTLVDAYLAEELLKNLDMGWDSFYLHKNRGGKLCVGPLWDFDLSLGNSNSDCQYVDGLYCAVGNDDTTMQRNPWFIVAMKLDWFRTLVSERWDEMYPRLAQYPDQILAMGAKYEASFKRNFVVWDIFGTRQNRETPLITSLATYREHYEYLSAWLDGRMEWLDGFFDSEAYASGEYDYLNGTDAASAAQAKQLARALDDRAMPLNAYINRKHTKTTAVPVEGRDVTLLFDGDTATKWYTDISPAESCVEITWRTSERVTLSGYTVATANNTSQKAYRNPLVWVLYGSVNGKDWVLLDMVGNASEVLGATDETVFGFEVDDKGSYNRFRLRLCCDRQVQLSELVIYGSLES